MSLIRRQMLNSKFKWTFSAWLQKRPAARSHHRDRHSSIKWLEKKTSPYFLPLHFCIIYPAGVIFTLALRPSLASFIPVSETFKLALICITVRLGLLLEIKTAERI